MRTPHVGEGRISRLDKEIIAHLDREGGANLSQICGGMSDAAYQSPYPEDQAAYRGHASSTLARVRRLIRLGYIEVELEPGMIPVYMSVLA